MRKPIVQHSRHRRLRRARACARAISERHPRHARRPCTVPRRLANYRAFSIVVSVADYQREIGNGGGGNADKGDVRGSGSPRARRRGACAMNSALPYALTESHNVRVIAENM